MKIEMLKGYKIENLTGKNVKYENRNFYYC